MQDLPFSWEDSKFKFCKKIHSNYGSSYCGKEKIEFEVVAGETDGAAAETPGGNWLAIYGVINIALHTCSNVIAEVRD